MLGNVIQEDIDYVLGNPKREQIVDQLNKSFEMKSDFRSPDYYSQMISKKGITPSVNSKSVVGNYKSQRYNSNQKERTSDNVSVFGNNI